MAGNIGATSEDGPRGYFSDFDRLFLAFKAFGGGIWDYEVDRDHLHCNDRWYEILGTNRDTVPIKSMSDFKPFIHLDDTHRATKVDYKELHELMEMDKPYHVDFRIIRSDGAVRWVRSVASLVEDSTHHLWAIGCMTDITEFHEILHPRAGQRRNHVIPIDDGVAESLAQEPGPLTDKEKECLLWVSLGKTAWETATIIQRSPRTVEFHLANAIKKLNASNKIHAVAIAIRSHLL